MKRALLLLAAGVIPAIPASAQELTYGGLLASYQQFESDGDTIDATLFAAEFGVALGFGFDAWISGATADIDASGLPVTLTADEMTIGLGYTFGETFRADFSASSLSAGAIVGADVHMKEIGFAYDNGTTFGRLSYTDIGNSDTLGVDHLWGLHVGYDGPQGLSASASAHWVDERFDVVDQPLLIVSLGYEAQNWEAELDVLDIEVASTDVTVWSLSGSYDFTPSWGTFGSVTRASATGEDVTLTRIGGSYNFNQRTRAYLDVSRLSTSLGDEHANGFGLGITMDLGDKRGSYETTTDRLSGVAEGIAGYDF